MWDNFTDSSLEGCNTVCVVIMPNVVLAWWYQKSEWKPAEFDTLFLFISLLCTWIILDNQGVMFLQTKTVYFAQYLASFAVFKYYMKQVN